MSDNSNRVFTRDTILRYLLNNGFPFEVDGVTKKVVNNGKHIVYSSDGKYKGCGISAGNTSCSSNSIPISSVKDRCGPEYGKCANKNACCSDNGYCGTTSEYCGIGCQPQYGLCSNFNANSIPVSTLKGRCGPLYGKCADENACCSSKGYCDISSAHCGTGCQPEYGLCGNVNDDSIPVSTVKGRCGPEYGKCADENTCCSSKGYCDTKSAHCGTGCQPKYGLCGSINVIPVSTVEDRCDRCGLKFGKCADKNACCSSKGYCDTTSTHCGTGCQPEYGLCGDVSDVNSIPVSTTKDRCGPEYGKCADENACCSSKGYCGTTKAYCGTGCQPEYGLCGNVKDDSISESIAKNRCGPGYGKCANENACCSQYGWCGTESAHCGTGCQPEYGLCGNVNDDSTPVSTVKDRCGEGYGKCANENACCSQYGWCGTESAHCGTGCQPKYGLCGNVNSIPVSTVKDRCGEGYGKCANENACCSQYGWCGTKSDHCGTGCQPKYGICN
ncbi:carbohydrate-binding module family 18 protein [Piromyces sp. E2]|nr:carbohydrate-binding module family 18 protein [Piromyces sp. E2]|eukprot:OUM64766.1 carbohydrate-binding module family 18 protein [Piromyces sp. E2]